MLVAGDSRAIEPQPVSVVAWSCGTGVSARGDPARLLTRSQSEDDRDLSRLLERASTWRPATGSIQSNGTPRTVPAASVPAGFPVHIPQLQFAIDYPPVPADELEGLALASGDIHSGHADFWNTWHQDKLTREVTQCIGRNLVCNVSG